MELTRKQVIELLEKHHMWTGEPQEVVDVRLENAALEYAISSLKTDEAYQLMYEGEEIFTKADMVAMLTDMQLEFEEELNCGAYCDECHESCEDIPATWFLDFIQEKINALKGKGNNGNNVR